MTSASSTPPPRRMWLPLMPSRGRPAPARVQKHGEAASSHGHEFNAFVLETYGWCGPQADSLMQSAAVASMVPGAYRDIREGVAVAVQRGNALLARHGLELVKRAAIGAPSDHAACLALAPRKPFEKLRRR